MDRAKDFMYGKYEDLRNYMERDTVGSQIVLYGISSGMLLTAFIKRRPSIVVQQYKKPSHVPNKLITERAPLTGTVCDIQQRDADTLLMLISQRPWIPLFSNSERTYPVKLAGVKLNSNGHAWLQNCLIGRHATFIPLYKRGKIDDDNLLRKLILMHPLNMKKGRLIDISEILLKLRFAEYTSDVNLNDTNKKYFKQLKRIEDIAKNRAAWVSWAARYPWIWNNWHKLKAAILPKQNLLPELVR